jgi:hypothetical protein
VATGLSLVVAAAAAEERGLFAWLDPSLPEAIVVPAALESLLNDVSDAGDAPSECFFALGLKKDVIIGTPQAPSCSSRSYCYATTTAKKACEKDFARHH